VASILTLSQGPAAVEILLETTFISIMVGLACTTRSIERASKEYLKLSRFGCYGGDEEANINFFAGTEFDKLFSIMKKTPKINN